MVMHSLIIIAYTWINFHILYKYGLYVDVLGYMIGIFLMCLCVFVFEIKFRLSNKPLEAMGFQYLCDLAGFLFLIPIILATPIDNITVWIYIYVGVVFGFWCLFLFLPSITELFLRRYDPLYQPLLVCDWIRHNFLFQCLCSNFLFLPSIAQLFLQRYDPLYPPVLFMFNVCIVFISNF